MDVCGKNNLIKIIVPSSVIASFYYDKNNLKLEIRFVSGVRYSYSDVPSNIYEEMKKSKSKGVYFNQKIKDKYAFERIS